MNEEIKSAISDLVGRYNSSKTIGSSGFKLRPVGRDDIRAHCQACGSYQADISGEIILIGEKEFESFKCKKCDTIGVVPGEKKPMEDIHKWLAALKLKIESFHLD